MKLMRLIVLGIGSIVMACVASDSVNLWHGEYFYESAGGHTAGGSPITMEMTLTINKPEADDACLFHAVGFQTDMTIVCTVTASDNKLEVKFKKYGEASFLMIEYKIGEVLFSLEKVAVKGKESRYVPHWVSYEPFDDMSNAKGYFKKPK
ncbi:MAG: hypothetical protein HY080_05040 [Gammaproteobacteria bacterium]|nr:hypothetical protein [Gammaproteobacteria bacterium]